MNIRPESRKTLRLFLDTTERADGKRLLVEEAMEDEDERPCAELSTVKT